MKARHTHHLLLDVLCGVGVPYYACKSDGKVQWDAPAGWDHSASFDQFLDDKKSDGTPGELALQQTPFSQLYCFSG